jgi:hypothetical protein
MESKMMKATEIGGFEPVECSEALEYPYLRYSKVFYHNTTKSISQEKQEMSQDSTSHQEQKRLSNYYNTQLLSICLLVVVT